MWARWRDARSVRHWDEDVHAQLTDRLPGTWSLDPSAQQRWKLLTRRFLSDKQFVGADGLQITAEHGTTIATLAAWPMLNLGWEALRGWREVVLYPMTFTAERHLAEPLCDGLEVVHEFEESLSGEAAEGVIVLAWEDIQLDLAHLDAGTCVVIHEIAHQFDARSGAIDGRPPLTDGLSGAQWSQDFQAAFDRLKQTLETGGEPAIDPYAAEAPEEFFAVMVEHYCLRPDWLDRDCPEVLTLLRKLFGEIRDPAPSRS
ncbi:MAG: zinc-dependent peptidase [Lysobacterales bacterium]